jgi:hypothetical protein
MKQHQFYNIKLAYQLDREIQDIGKWNGIQFKLHHLGDALGQPIIVRHAGKVASNPLSISAV